MSICTVRILVVHEGDSDVRNALDGADLRVFAAEFPTVALRLRLVPEHTPEPATLSLPRWLDRTVDFPEFDRAVDFLVREGPATLVLQGPRAQAVRAAAEMLTRWQRHLDRRNRASATRAFDGALSRLRNIHDCSKPLVRADWNHALDTWQWMLRLDSEASCAAQLAALAHDVERLESEADLRVEHLAESYQRFKEAHARRGAAIARGVLEPCALGRATLERAVELVADHERPGDDAERALLNDADGLSFFSQNSAGYADYFGAAQTARKIAYTIARMRSTAVARLSTLRLRADVAELLTTELRRVHA